MAVILLWIALSMPAFSVTTEEALIRSIQLHPGEDTPRLMYADYLDELGGDSNAARAEFIRLQLKVARKAGAVDELLAWEDRISLLRAQYEKGWIPRALFLKDVSLIWERGFLSEIALDRQRFCRKSSMRKAIDSLPLLRRLSITGYHSESEFNLVEKLNSLRSLERLRSLTLGRTLLGDTDVERIAWKKMTSLVELNLKVNFISTRGLQVVLDEVGSQLLSLDVSGNRLTDLSLALFAWPHTLPRLQHLNLEVNNLIELPPNEGWIDQHSMPSLLELDVDFVVPPDTHDLLRVHRERLPYQGHCLKELEILSDL